jgi:hypothetical protein
MIGVLGIILMAASVVLPGCATTSLKDCARACERDKMECYKDETVECTCKN